MKDPPVHEIRLSVDDEYLLPHGATFLLQRDPFPGGHRYKLRITGINPAKYIGSMESGEVANPEWELSKTLEFVASNLIDQTITFQNMDGSPKFFMNSIDLLTIGEDEVYFEGTCSEVKSPY